MLWGPTAPSTLKEEVTGESHINQDPNLLFPMPRASISLGAGGTPMVAHWQSGPLASPLGFRAQGACRWGVRQPQHHPHLVSTSLDLKCPPLCCGPPREGLQ